MPRGYGICSSGRRRLENSAGADRRRGRAVVPDTNRKWRPAGRRRWDVERSQQGDPVAANLEDAPTIAVGGWSMERRRLVLVSA